MERLQKRRVEVDDAAGTKNAVQLSCRVMGIAEMLKHDLAHHGIERVISKGQPGARAHEIRPLVLHGVKIHNVAALRATSFPRPVC